MVATIMVSNRMFWTFMALVFICQALDLVLAAMYLTPEIEFNPIASWLWSNYGLGGLALMKGTMLMIAFSAMIVVNRMNQRYAVWTMLFLLILSAIPLIMYTLI